ncbi:serine hydrolase domain-containing protein [Nannocystaceae bacterium ST9]
MRGFLPAALVASLAACVHTTERSPAQVRREAAIEVAEGRAPAVVIATIHGDDIEVEAAGDASLAEHRPADPDTAFALFSISKLFTATAILQLHERGLLDIDAPVHDYLGDELAIDEPRERPITARDLLRHGSGLGNPSVWARARPWQEPRPSCEALLAALLAEHGRKLRYRPGRGQHYSNLGYLVLGRLIEVVDGRDYETYVEQEILAVLGMDRTGFSWGPLLDDAATGHSRKRQFYTRLAKRKANPAVFGEPLPEWETTLPFHVDGSAYGGMIGTAPDLAKFAAAQLGEGSWQGRRILSPASIELMREVQRDDRDRILDFALGWHTGKIEGERYYNHMGKGGGFRPEIRLWPARDYAVVILTNLTKFDPRPISQQVPPQ